MSCCEQTQLCLSGNIMSPPFDSATEKCPLCKKSSRADFRPFCSALCKDRDLLQWLGDGYRIAGPELLSEESDFSSPQDRNED